MSEVDQLVTAVTMGWEIRRHLVIPDKESIPELLSSVPLMVDGSEIESHMPVSLPLFISWIQRESKKPSDIL
jgi:hypothetical protein